MTHTLEELRKRATAAELTLIDATVAATHTEAIAEVRRNISDWLAKNAPPIEFCRHNGQDWFIRLQEFMNSTTPTP